MGRPAESEEFLKFMGRFVFVGAGFQPAPPRS
jgi:hypothetical protein